MDLPQGFIVLFWSIEMDEELKLTPNEEASITEGSKYLTTAKGYKSKFDMTEILVEGKFPHFENTADKVACAVELGQFVRNNGWGINTDNLHKFLTSIDLPHRVIFVQQLKLSQLELAFRDDKLKPIMKELPIV